MIASDVGWIDPPHPWHTCYDEQPKNLTREDWQRRWRCSCGRVYRVADSQRDGYYFEPLPDDPEPTANGDSGTSGGAG